MATSSIFHNVILREPEEIEAFIRAAEASEKNPYKKPEGAPTYRALTSEEVAEWWKNFNKREELKK